MFKVEFSTAGAAFETGADEVVWILRRLAERVCLEHDGGSFEAEGLIRDSNGNHIGDWSMDIDPSR
jgi:hypothetical protein